MRINDGKISNISRLEKSEDIEQRSKIVDEEVKADIEANATNELPKNDDIDNDTTDNSDDDGDGEV